MSINKLTLDQALTYEIKVPGSLNARWLDWDKEMKIVVASDELGSPITSLTGILDQAALQGLLRLLYSRGLPIISVICLDVDL